MAELGEAGGGDQADPAGADDTYRLSLAQFWFSPALGSSVMPLAISSISRSESDWASVLVTQKEPSSSCQATIRSRSPS